MTDQSTDPLTDPIGLPVIDVCGVVFDTECWEAYLRGFAEDAPGYLRHFGPTLAFHAGADLPEYEAACERDPFEAVEVLTAAGGLAKSLDEHVASLERQQVRQQVLHGSHRRLLMGDGNVNDRVATWANKQPHLLQAWAGLDLANAKTALDELDRCVGELGMVGVSIVPFWSAADPDAAGSHRIYARVAELGVPIWIHVGMNLATNRLLASTTWAHIDSIAVAHPDLTVIAGHGGWPWITEGIAVLQRHPNVYVEISAHRPRVIGKPGSGWEPLVFYGQNILRHKVLFGSAGFVHRLSTRDLADEVASLGLGDTTTAAWLHDNAARLLL